MIDGLWNKKILNLCNTNFWILKENIFGISLIQYFMGALEK